MRIVIDMQGAQTSSLKSGIGRYVCSFVRALLQHSPPADQILLLFNGQLEAGLHQATYELRDVISPRQLRCWYAAQRLNSSSDDTLDDRLVAQQIYAELIVSLAPDLLLMTSLFEGFHDDGMTDLTPALLNHTNVACILYDLASLRHSSAFRNDPRYRDFYFHKISLLQRVHHVLSVSHYSLCDYLAASGHWRLGQTVRVVGAACDADWPGKRRGPARPTAHAADIVADPFLLFVGSCEPRDNLAGLLESCACLTDDLRADLVVVVAGIGHDVDDIRRQALQSGLNPDRVHVRADCDDDEICQLYQACHLCILPSLAEGFAHRALQAIEAGAVCIGSNTGGLFEAIGCSQALFDPKNTLEVAELIDRAWSDASFRSLLIKQQQGHANKLTWSSVASRALQVIHELEPSKPASALDVTASLDLSHAVASRLGRLSSLLSVNKPNLAGYIQHTFRQNEAVKRIFVDVSQVAVEDFKTGIQRVVRSILCSLAEIFASEWQVIPVYAISDKPGYFVEGRLACDWLPPMPGDQQVGSPALMHSGDILLVLDLHHTVALAQQEFLRSLRSRGVSVYFVVYDILPIQLPDCFSDGACLSSIHAQWLALISQMDGYFAISRTVRDQVEEWMRLNSPPVHPSYCHGYFHLGADLSASVPSRGLPAGHALILEQLASRPSFLQVSTLEPRKGAAQLLSAFEILWREGHDLNLVLVGKRGWLVDDLVAHINGHPELDRRLFWLQGISDEMLDLVYGACSCSVMASYGEGFGLPLVEAAQKGLPIIARDIPVFREVAGDAAFFFQAETAQELASSINAWLALEANGQQPSSSSLRWLSWRESARMLADNMLHAYHRNLSPSSVR